MIFRYLLILFLLSISYMAFEAGWLKVTRIDHSKGKKGFKIIQLSDIHISNLSISARAVKRVIDRENPDLIIFTGDYIERGKDTQKYLAFHGEVTGNRRSIACTGNHDYKAFSGDSCGFAGFLNGIGAAGTSMLINSTVCFSKGGKKYSFTGIDEIHLGHPDIAKALSSIPPDTDVRVGLAHNPDTVLSIPKGKLDYMFCGHFHGGQFWMPFNLEFILLRKEILCRKGCRRGLHRVNGVNIYINRGLGGVFAPLRFLSRPEITVFTLP